MIITIFKFIHEPVKDIGIYWILYYYSYLTIYVCVCVIMYSYDDIPRTHPCNSRPLPHPTGIVIVFAIYVYTYIISQRTR